MLMVEIQHVTAKFFDKSRFGLNDGTSSIAAALDETIRAERLQLRQAIHVVEHDHVIHCPQGR
jgi:hypothetical protein